MTVAFKFRDIDDDCTLTLFIDRRGGEGRLSWYSGISQRVTVVSDQRAPIAAEFYYPFPARPPKMFLSVNVDFFQQFRKCARLVLLGAMLDVPLSMVYISLSMIHFSLHDLVGQELVGGILGC